MDNLKLKVQEKLFRSINSGNLKRIQESLEEYPELINERKHRSGYKYGLFYEETPLTLAIGIKLKDESNINIIKYLLNNGADPDIPNLKGKMPLEIAEEILGEKAMDLVTINPQKILKGESIETDVYMTTVKRETYLQKLRRRIFS